jgi:hypothetical protein
MITIQTIKELDHKATTFVVKGKENPLNVAVIEIYENNTIKCLVGKALFELNKAQENNQPYEHILKESTNYIIVKLEDIIEII